MAISFSLDVDDKGNAKAPSKNDLLPKAYIFLGQTSDKDVAATNGATRDPQEWRKLFLFLTKLSGVKANKLGLIWVYDAIEEVLAGFKGPDKKKFEAAFKTFVEEQDKKDAEELQKRLDKMAEKAKK